jgi:hypothetical protein
MSKAIYLIELHVDEGWFNAINDFTADVHEDEICKWVRVQAETIGDEDLTDDDDDEIIDVDQEHQHKEIE